METLKALMTLIKRFFLGTKPEDIVKRKDLEKENDYLRKAIKKYSSLNNSLAWNNKFLESKLEQTNIVNCRKH